MDKNCGAIAILARRNVLYIELSKLTFAVMSICAYGITVVSSLSFSKNPVEEYIFVHSLIFISDFVE